MKLATLPTSGYSGTPLATKLGLKDGMRAAFVALPAEWDVLVDSASFFAADKFDGWRDAEGEPERYNAIHAFTKKRAEIEGYLPALQSAIRRDGMIWVSWPKKASKVPTDVTEDVVRGEALKLDLVDVKVAAIDEVWSGLKLVIRKDRR
jgi:hypothetical protein